MPTTRPDRARGLLLLLALLVPGTGLAAAERDVGFATITTPPSAAVGAEVAVTVAVPAATAAAGMHLVVDMHAMIGAGTRKAGLGSRRFALPQGQASTHTARFTVPDLEGIERLKFPVYVTPGGWKEKVHATEADVAVGDAPVQQRAAAPAPAAIRAEPLPIEQPPLERLSATRDELVLSGPWRFHPAGDRLGFEPIGSEEWGQIWVPGTWGQQRRVLPGVIRTGAGDGWRSFDQNLISAWYEREVTVPAAWAGRTVILDLARVSTEATVYVDGIECGHVTWPGGRVDLTRAVRPGERATIRVRVFAVESGGMEFFAMGTVDADSMRRARLEARGLIGDVILASRPRGAHVDDVLVEPSVSERRLGLRVVLQDAAAGEVAFTARLFDLEGTLERTFTRRVAIEAAERQVVELAWDWADPRLWDIGQGELYDLRLEASGAGLADEYATRFGFREFGIEGKDFVLNGRVVRLRPWCAPVGDHNGGGMREMVEDAVATLQGHGLNMIYIWPSDPARRGSIAYTLYQQWFDAADRRGMLMTAPVPWFDIRGETRDTIDWTAAKRAAYQARVERHLRRHRNHPSIVLWGGTANQFPLQQAHNPRLIGRSQGLPDGLRDYTGKNDYRQLVAAGRDAIDAFKELDPTRPFYCHHDSFVGEVSSYNLYLNMHPLQEREDWLSHYAEHGDVPFASHEFGTPVDVAFTRGRSGNHGRSLGSEPLVSEFCAIYFGAEAYRLESPEYRAAIGESYRRDLPQETPYPKWGALYFLSEDTPNHQAFQALFVRNTWRSWRTWGLPGGLYPWWAGNFTTPRWAGNLGFRRSEGGDRQVAMPDFEQGRRGPYLAQMPVGVRRYLDTSDEGGYRAQEAGRALLANNGPTLAWIAGPEGRFTAKDHLFTRGETVAKQLVVINDELHPAPPYRLRWWAEIGGERIDGGELAGSVESGQRLLLPIAVTVDAVGDGVIRLEADIGGHAHSDAFRFRVHPPAEAARGREVAMFDPEGTTTAWLESLGYRCRPWTGDQVPLVVVGRNALSGGVAPPAGLEDHVRAGGRLVVCNQDPAWLREQAGLRIAPYPTRRVWPVDPGHPLVAGLDGEDFRDWRGAGSAIPEERNTDIVRDKPHPNHGWHWGNRGSVASSVPEKPHFSGWRPILEAEFDLAYAPLLENALGEGLALWCALDLEGRTIDEPMAAMLTHRLIDYALHAQPRASGATGYLGDAEGRRLLESMGVELTEARPDACRLVVAGPGCSEDELRPFTEQGTPILVLARRAARAPFGVGLARREAFAGALEAPGWEETRGLSPSDLRLRSHSDWWVLADGCEIGADGLLGRKRVGASTVVYCQLDPEALRADERRYFRYTRWRQHRALANLLANLGAGFQADGRLFGTDGQRLYHPDYSHDFVSGDDPFRWNAW